jgi:hypothetical protein
MAADAADEKQTIALLILRGCECAATMKPFAGWRYAVTCAQLPSLCVESGTHVCCFRTQLDVNGARTLLFGRAWSACCNKTQSVHVDDLFILIEERLLLFQNSAEVVFGARTAVR